MSSTLWRVSIADYATYAVAATLCAVDTVTRSIAIDTADLLAMSGLCVRVQTVWSSANNAYADCRIN